MKRILIRVLPGANLKVLHGEGQTLFVRVVAWNIVQTLYARARANV